MVASLLFSFVSNAQEIRLSEVDSVVKLKPDCELIYASVKGLPMEKDAMFAISEKVQSLMPVKKVRWTEGKEQIRIIAMEQDLDVMKIIEVMNAAYAEYREKKMSERGK